MKTFKTLMALLLALALVCALFVPVWADGETSSDDPEPDTTAAPDETTAAPTEPETTAAGAEETTAAPAEAGNGLTPSPETPVAPPAETVKPADPAAAAEFKMTWTPAIEFIRDYSKYYKLGDLELGECALIKAYILNEDGTIYSYKIDIKEHHNRTITLYWNGLDQNGTHPAGSWNKPTAARFTLVVVATDIDGYDHVFSTYFTYNFYDTLGAAGAKTAGAANGAKGDVPHTGL